MGSLRHTVRRRTKSARKLQSTRGFPVISVGNTQFSTSRKSALDSWTLQGHVAEIMMENTSVINMNNVINNVHVEEFDYPDNNFSDIDCGSDDSIFGDSTSESDMYEFGHMNIISDSALFDSYFSIQNILGTDESLPKH